MQGNGSGKIEIGVVDRGSWVQVRLSRHDDLRDDIHAAMSDSLAQWFTGRPQLRLRFVVPIQRDGTTVELHAWYDGQS
jgi:hypothetical protein